MRLKDKTIIITGAGSGLGKQMSLSCAKEGANIVLADINEQAMSAVSKEIEALGGKSVQCVVNVTNADSVRAMVDAGVKAFSKVDGLVNSAGIFHAAPFVELQEMDWDRMININLKGSFLCTQAVIREMLKQGNGGSIIFLSSISGFVGFAKSASYCASKGAVRQLSKALALEFGPNDIRCNVIAPGTIETPMNDWIKNDPAMYKQSVASIPAGRFGTPEEIANAAVFLLSDDASFCSGAELIVDGGQITHC